METEVKTETTPKSEPKTNFKWYIIKVQANREKMVCEKIKEEVDRLNITRLVQSVLVPSEKSFFMKNNKKVSRDKIMYPGYVFIETNALGEVKQILRDLSIGGFLKTKSGEIEPMRNYDIDKILGRMTSSQEDIETTFLIGEEVKIMDGPFNGFKGKISDITGTKVFVGVPIFGRVTNMELNTSQIDKL